MKVGDVLIRGNVEIFDNEGNVREKINVHADGDILLECRIRTSFEIPLMKTVKTETGNYKKYTFCRYGDRYRIQVERTVEFSFRQRGIGRIDYYRQLAALLQDAGCCIFVAFLLDMTEVGSFFLFIFQTFFMG